MNTWLDYLEWLYYLSAFTYSSTISNGSSHSQWVMNWDPQVCDSIEQKDEISIVFISVFSCDFIIPGKKYCNSLLVNLFPSS